MNTMRLKFEEIMGFNIEWCSLNEQLELVPNDLGDVFII